MHAISTIQIADILYFNDKANYQGNFGGLLIQLNYIIELWFLRRLVQVVAKITVTKDYSKNVTLAVISF